MSGKMMQDGTSRLRDPCSSKSICDALLKTSRGRNVITSQREAHFG